MAATDRDWFVAAALALRDRIVDRWLRSARDDSSKNRKRVYYLSLEFLPGRLFLDSLNNSGLTEPMRLALGQLGVDLERLRAVSPIPHSATAGSDGSPPASWRAWRAWAFPRSASAFATISGCSSR
jgi:glucan phosphorylase